MDIHGLSQAMLERLNRLNMNNKYTRKFKMLVTLMFL